MCKALAQPLQNDSLFAKVNLADTLLGDDGCTVIAQSLKANQSLEYLDMRGNNIRSNGAISLAQLLKVNSTLKGLYLEWNCIGIWDNGIQALADALSINQSLEDLDLRNNKIGPHGVATLATSLKANKTLQKMDLRWNNSGLIGGRALLESLKWNRSLQTIELAGNEIPDDILSTIELALQRNRQFHADGIEKSARSHYLASTIQQISSEHDAVLGDLQAKIMRSDMESQSMGQKLQMASEEMDQSHMAYKIVEAKLTEERARRENSDAKLLLMEETMARERKEFNDRCKGLVHDLVQERENRVRGDENLRNQFAKANERALEAEALMREHEVRAEIGLREKTVLTADNVKLRAQIVDLEKSYDETIGRMRKNEHHSRQQMESQYAQENQMLSKKIYLAESNCKSLEQERESLNETLKNLDARIRQDELMKRQDVIQKLQSTSQQRDSVQQALLSLKLQHKQMVADYEARFARESGNRKDLEAHIAKLNDSLKKSIEQYDQLKEHTDSWRARELELTEKLKKAEDRCLIRDHEVGSLRHQLDKVREAEVGRAKELERAIVGYVRSVEHLDRHAEI